MVLSRAPRLNADQMMFLALLHFGTWVHEDGVIANGNSVHGKITVVDISGPPLGGCWMLMNWRKVNGDGVYAHNSQHSSYDETRNALAAVLRAQYPESNDA